MKITKTSDQELNLDESAATQFIIGGVFALVGIAGPLAVFLFNLASPNGASGSGSWIFAVSGGIFAVVGVLFVVFASKKHVALRNPGESTVTKTRIFGGKAKSASFDAANVAAVRLITTTTRQRERDPDGDTHYETRRESRLSIVLRDNTEIIIANGGQSNVQRIGLGPIGLLNALDRSVAGPAPYSNEARQIADFFHVPLNAVDDGSVSAGFTNFANYSTNGGANLAVMTAAENPTIDHIREQQAMASARGQVENPAQPSASVPDVAQNYAQAGASAPSVAQNPAAIGAAAPTVAQNPASVLQNPDGSPADIPRGLSFGAPNAQLGAPNPGVIAPGSNAVAPQNPQNPGFSAPQTSAQNPNPGIPRENNYR